MTSPPQAPMNQNATSAPNRSQMAPMRIGAPSRPMRDQKLKRPMAAVSPLVN